MKRFPWFKVWFISFKHTHSKTEQISLEESTIIPPWLQTFIKTISPLHSGEIIMRLCSIMMFDIGSHLKWIRTLSYSHERGPLINSERGRRGALLSSPRGFRNTWRRQVVSQEARGAWRHVGRVLFPPRGSSDSLPSGRGAYLHPHYLGLVF